MDIKKLSNKDWQLLSDLLDGQLDTAKSNKVMKRLEKEPALHTAYENLRWIKNLMQQMPHRRVPHNYILTRHMAAEATKGAGNKRSYYGLASVLASLIFVVLLAIQLVPNLPFTRFVSKSPQSEEIALREMVVEDEAEEPAMEMMAVPETITEESMDAPEFAAAEGEVEATPEEEPMLEAFSLGAPVEESEELFDGEVGALNADQALTAEVQAKAAESKPLNWLFIATVVSGLTAFALVFINQKNRRNF
jgi:anti-sigma factor RsiW